jgi:hypothetical protein
MSYKQYLRNDGTLTSWLQSPESDTDREIYTLSPLRRKYKSGEMLNHKLGKLECISCERIVNDDECGGWGGPSFIGNFVRSDNLAPVSARGGGPARRLEQGGGESK